MGFWATLGVYAALWAINRFLLPQEANEDEADKRPEVDFPVDQEGAPIPICYGRNKLSTARVAWWGDGEFIEVPGGGGDFPSNLLQIGMQFILSLEVENPELYKIYVGESVAYSSTLGITNDKSQETDESYKLTDSDLDTTWASDGRGFFPPGGSGFYEIRWYPGTFTQGQNAYLAATLSPSPVPNFRGKMHIVFEKVLLGSRPTPPPLSFEIAGYPDAVNGASTRAVPAAGGEANAAEVIYDILTKEWGRLGIDPPRINLASFQSVAVDTHAEGLGVSVLIDGRREAQEILAEILFHIDAVLYLDPFTDELVLKLIREDYSIGSLPSFGDSEIDLDGMLSVERTTWEEGIDQVRITFPQRNHAYKPKVALVQNMAAYFSRSPARTRNRQMKLPHARVAGPAVNIATRELLLMSTPLLKMKIAFNKKVIDLRPGEPFLLSHDFGNFTLTDVVMRVGAIDFGSLDDERIIVDCLQDRFATQEAPFGDPVGFPTVVSQPSEETVRKTIEMPQWIGYVAEVRGLVANRDHVRHFYMVEKNGVENIGYRPRISADGGAYVYDPGAQRKFHQTALVETEYSRTNDPYDTSVGIRIDNVTDETGSLQNRTEAQIRDGSNLTLAVTPAGKQVWFAFESFTVIGGGIFRLDNVWPGILDTSAITLPVGTRLWFIDDAVTFLTNLGKLGFVGDEDMDIRIETSSGERVLDTSSQTPEDLQLVKRSLLPYPVDNLLFQEVVEGLGSLAALAATNQYPGIAVGGEANPWVVEAELVSTWRRRNRKATAIQRGDDVSVAPGEGITHDVQSDDGGGFDTLSGGSDVDAATAQVNLQATGFGPADLRVDSERTIEGAPFTSFEPPEVLAQLAHYRQLLINPHFDDAVDGRGWNHVSGPTPSYVSGGTSLGFVGKHVTPSGLGTTILDQVIDVASLLPSGKDVVLEVHVRDFDSAASPVTITLDSEDIGSSVLDTVTINATPPVGEWDWHELRLTGLDPNTVQLRLTAEMVFQVGGGGAQGAIDGFRLRMAPAISSQLLTNPDFNTDLSGWTPTNMAQQTIANSEGAGYAFGSGAVASCSLVQDSIALSGHAEGDVLEFRCMRLDAGLDTGEVIVEIHNNAEVVQVSATTGPENITGVWQERKLFVRVPAGANLHAEVRFEGVTIGGGNIDAGIDNCRLYMHDLT
jgi:hypothetical protein